MPDDARSDLRLSPTMDISRLSRRRLLGATAAVGASGLLLPGAARAASAPPKRPTGHVVIGFSQEPTVFNPLMPHIEVDQGVHWNLFSPLWLANEKGDLVPELAAEVPTITNGGISKDGLSWRVKLRPGVKWHDGQPFTADDVKFSFDLLNNPKFRAWSRNGYELMRDITVVSPTELTWKMSKPYAPMVSILCWTFMVPAHILGKAADPNTSPFNQAPVGTGAFMWKQRVPGDHITLAANPHYFGTGPYLEEIIFKYIPDLTVMFTQFQTGSIDYIGLQGITADHYNQAKKLKDRVVVVGPAPFIESITMNLSKLQFKERAVREALYYGMDNKTIVEQIYYGLPKLTSTYLPTQSWAYNPHVAPHVYDPAKAKSILDAAGWKPGSGGIREKNGVRLSFQNSTTAGNHVREQAQQLLQQNWQDIGVEMKIKNMPPAVIWGDYFNMSHYDSVMVGEDFMTGPDPDVSQYFLSSAIPAKGGAGQNTMEYVNHDVDKLLTDGAETFDRAKRKADYWKAAEIIRHDLPQLPIFQYATIEGTKKNLIGYKPSVYVSTNTWNVNTWYWAA
ncbi:MAG: ABC transporter substrate-binding protein [Rhodospirillales bacterium]|nr:ABC transporter substrate-binding protein [Rhodospirillales bacterium]